MTALGRRFKLGVNYDYRHDHLLSGKTCQKKGFWLPRVVFKDFRIT